ncbi:BadF/BadG/BcrA/BcrD ATPase family protein [Actinacidiphila sp. bgisy145]|uniref:BadF/BadG/BcrA/BcrD ATPase family protein n=1 Tax=Actinacidiphila sp. bgisy145 TaxID=3413792 RepID=UPI003EBF54F6
MTEIYSHPVSGGSGAGAAGRPPLVVGIDAGGTRSRACLAEGGPGGRVLGRGTGGPGNALSVGRGDLTRHLAAAVGEALAEAASAPRWRADGGELRDRVGAAFGGFAGAAPGAGPERGAELAVSCLRDALAAHGITGVPVGIGGDTEVALAAAPGAPADGLVLIAGTGAIAARLAGGRSAAVSDGHGWLLGDEGSGFWLGNRAARAALEALDGRGPWTALVPRVVAHFLGGPAGAGDTAGGEGSPGGGEGSAGGGEGSAGGGEGSAGGGEGSAGGGEELRRALAVGPASDPVARHLLGELVVTRAYAQAPARLGALSPAVVEEAAGGDAVARGLLDTAAGLLAATVRSLAPRPGEPLVVTGGLLGPGGPLLARVTERLADHGLRVFPVADGSAGAAALARGLL